MHTPALTPFRRFTRENVAVAAACVLAFSLLDTALLVLQPPGAVQRAVADPLVIVLRDALGTPAFSVLPALIALIWLVAGRPSPATALAPGSTLWQKPGTPHRRRP